MSKIITMIAYILIAIFALFAVLRVTGVALLEWSWFWISLPGIIAFVIWIVMIILAVGFGLEFS